VELSGVTWSILIMTLHAPYDDQNIFAKILRGEMPCAKVYEDGGTLVIMDAFPDGIVITQFNGAPAGQTVFHTHVHIIPRYAGQDLGTHGSGMADRGELQSLAEQIRHELET